MCAVMCMCSMGVMVPACPGVKMSRVRITVWNYNRPDFGMVMVRFVDERRDRTQ